MSAVIQPVILCGGGGTRLWPRSRAARPKPFLPRLGERTLVQQALDRVADPARFAAPLVVAGELRAVIRDGRAEQRCREIARRAAEWDGLADDAVAVEIVTERHDVVERATGDASLVERTVHVRCEVPV